LRRPTPSAIAAMTTIMIAQITSCEPLIART
jgi:hypothetical protein